MILNIQFQHRLQWYQRKLIGTWKRSEKADIQQRAQVRKFKKQHKILELKENRNRTGKENVDSSLGF